MYARWMLTLLLISPLQGCSQTSGKESCRNYQNAWIAKYVDECMAVTRVEAKEALDADLAAQGFYSCEDVGKIRDQDEFEDCLVAIRDASCTAISAGDFILPHSCESQFVRGTGSAVVRPDASVVPSSLVPTPDAAL